MSSSIEREQSQRITRSISSYAVGFVGRERELLSLRIKLDNIFYGKGGLVTVSGEPGIGKSRLVQEFVYYAHLRDVAVLHVSCRESDILLPYHPWIESIGEYIKAIPSDILEKELGSNAHVLAQIIPHLRVLLPNIPSATHLSPEEDRFRLYDTITQFVLNISKKQPLVIIFDDLQWADYSSIRLLKHLFSFLEKSNVLVIGIYDNSLNIESPLIDLFRVISGAASYDRILLRNLDFDGVIDYLTFLAQNDFPVALGEVIDAISNGNPLFVEQIFLHLLEKGDLIFQNGNLRLVSNINELIIPENIHQVISHKIRQLSNDTQHILEIASVFRGTFEFRILQAAVDVPENVIRSCLNEALNARIISLEDTQNEIYHFVHNVFRSTLYNGMSPNQQVILNRQVAVAIETVQSEQKDQNAARLAYHYFESMVLPGADKGTSYALEAAQQAKDAYSYEQAAEFLRIAKELVLKSDKASRSEILCELAITEANAGLVSRATQSSNEALSALDNNNVDPNVTADFLVTISESLRDNGADVTLWMPFVERGLALLGDQHNLIWARLTLLLPPRMEEIFYGEIYSGKWFGANTEAIKIARASSEAEDYARTLLVYDWRSREETEAILNMARTWGSPGTIMRALSVVGEILQYRHGDYRRAHEVAMELLSKAESYGSLLFQAKTLVRLAMMEIPMGRLDMARETANRAKDVVSRFGPGYMIYEHVGTTKGGDMYPGPSIEANFAMYLEGDWISIAKHWAEATSIYEPGGSPVYIVEAAMIAQAYARAGKAAEARLVLDDLTSILERLGPKDWAYNGAVGRATHAIWDLGAVEYAPIYRKMALDLVEEPEIGDWNATSNELTVACMHALLGDMTQAEQYFGKARDGVDRSGQYAIRVVIDLYEAQALIRTGSRDINRIHALLDRTIEKSNEMGMLGWMKRAVGEAARLNRLEGRQ